MDDQYTGYMDGPASAATSESGAPSGEAPQDFMARLDAQSDETLRDMIGRAKALLAARKNERQERALTAIRKLARKHGLTVQASKQGRKRGRPPKQKEEGTECGT